MGVLDVLERPVEEHVSYEEHLPWLDGIEALPCREGKDGPLRPWGDGNGASGWTDGG